MVAESNAKQNFTRASEDAVNQQIQIYRMAQQTYLAASAYFDHCDIALPGLVKYFHERAEYEGRLAQHLIDYQATRGGVVIINAIPQPLTDWNSAFSAIETTLALEKDVNSSLLKLAQVAANNQDKHLLHTLKNGHLNIKVKTIYNVVRGVIQLQRVGGEGLGLYLLDQDLYEHKQFQ
ncbi:ferritin [Rhizopus microsporus ATCC 52813]|uniref:Ferritin n=1 Tax=Rhizopus microsporus ATCC 52813 TaxID=1340429 RepID=A0A2G4T6L1_RHIZD|nr:ferritin [Rhizopus microsporus ATCC 52813]PHZ16653.1 ferritin [Rhizopus microsporus ATCC 52813]